MSTPSSASMTFPELLATPPLDPSPFLPHCDKCGRFVRRATVRTVTHWEGLDHDEYGHCARCGEVGVTWTESANADEVSS